MRMSRFSFRFARSYRTLLALVCAFVCAVVLNGCGNNGQESAASSAESAETSATDATGSDATGSGVTGSGAANSDTNASNDAGASTKADGSSESKSDGKNGDKAEPAPKIDEALAKRWTEDFKRIADASGMQVCVRAIDLSTNTSVDIRGDEKMASASMIKLLIAETFLHKAADGAFALDGTYTLKDSDIVGGTGSLQGSGAGAEVSYKDLVFKMISESDNVATNVLIDACGMDAINKEAKALGLKASEVNRRMMDTDASAAGIENYTSANDLAALLELVYKQKFVNAEMSALMLQALEAQVDNECISQGLPAGVVFAHKTGSLGIVRHDGGIVEGQRPFILVTLCGGEGFSESGAMSTMAQLGEAAYAAVAQSASSGQGQEVASGQNVDSDAGTSANVGTSAGEGASSGQAVNASPEATVGQETTAGESKAVA